MRRMMVVPALLLGFTILGATRVRADTIVASATIVTSGTFRCLFKIAINCTGEGTDSITLGSGDNTATITFLGVNETFDVTNNARPHPLGAFEVTASEGFTFPRNLFSPGNPILRFTMVLNQLAPVSARGPKIWEFGTGGRTTLPLQRGTSHFERPIGPNAFHYTGIVYTTRPFPFTLRPGQTTRLNANVGAVPEPATLALLGTGLVGILRARARTKARR